jgi:hypothetical protein
MNLRGRVSYAFGFTDKVDLNLHNGDSRYPNGKGSERAGGAPL